MMRILVCQTGSIERCLQGIAAIARRFPKSAFIGLIRPGDMAHARESQAFAALHDMPDTPADLLTTAVWNQPFDAALLPLDDRLGMRYWNFRRLLIAQKVPLILTYNRLGRVRSRGRFRWIANTIAVSIGLRAVHMPTVWIWHRFKRCWDVPGIFLMAMAALALAGLDRIGWRPRWTKPGGRVPDGRRVVLFIPSLGVGGAQRQIVSFVSHLDRRRWDPEIVTLEVPDNCFASEIEALKVPIRYLNPHGASWRCGVAWRLRGLLTSRPAHVLHSWLHYSAALGAIAGTFAGVPVIVGSFRSERPGRFPWFYPRWQRAMDLLTVPLQTYLIANSNAVREENRRWAFIPSHKIITVYNGINPQTDDLSADARVEARLDLGVTDGAKLVGIVGRLYPEKDHATFLRAAARVAEAVPEARFLIIGEGRSRARIESDIRRLALGDRVRLVGHRPDAATMIQMLDVLVLTSVSEGFPNVLLEAAVAGVPVVTTAAGGAVEVVMDQETGFVVRCGDSDAIARRVTELLGDPLLRTQFVAAARDRVKRLFSAADMAAAIEASYDRALECLG